MKMWAGRFSKEENKEVNDFNSSIRVDSRMYKEDITGSMAHAFMLGKCGIISNEDSELIINTLDSILTDLENGNLEIDPEAEDIHMFVEEVLTNRIGAVGKKLHTARSRNDQVALDFRMYTKKEILEIKGLVKSLIETIIYISKQNIDLIMPGYTHLQRAQPILLSHQLLAYANMLIRDLGRLDDTYKRCDYMPLGSAALAGTTHNIDRFIVKEKLGFKNVTLNSIDSVSDRDFAVELANAISLIMMHLSRFSEEIILWCSWEFKFMELDDSYATGSSIMPQKKNPDITELIRGKTGRTYGNLIALLTMLKGIPLAYNKDMQEDKELLFDSIDTVKECLSIFIPMLKTATFLKDNMYNAAKKGFINATDLADYLAKKGMPFRDAYKLTGTIVKDAIKDNLTLDEIKLEKYKEYSELIDSDIYHEIDLRNCVDKRLSFGGTSKEMVLKQIELLTNELGK
ncbi:MAG: argininosuccinate lyase [Acholeplasmatales bacterium]|nr:argininosuccinate lyase [Acholeplasmatales bacterium]